MLSFPITDKKYIFLCSLTLKNILAYVSLPQYLQVLIHVGPLDRRVQLNWLFSWFYCDPVALMKGFTQNIFIATLYIV